MKIKVRSTIKIKAKLLFHETSPAKNQNTRFSSDAFTVLIVSAYIRVGGGKC